LIELVSQTRSIAMAQPHAVSGQVVSVRPLGPAIHDARTTALIKAD